LFLQFLGGVGIAEAETFANVRHHFRHIVAAANFLASVRAFQQHVLAIVSAEILDLHQ
jgi:hypothetical protein